MRILSMPNEYSRMELRSPDPSANPYLAFALLIGAGITGLTDQTPVPNALDVIRHLQRQNNLRDVTCFRIT
jgi:glutamine synthetase